MAPSLLFPDGAKSELFFDTPFSHFETLVRDKPVIFITDRNIMRLYRRLFPPSRTIILPPGEAQKNDRSVKQIYKALLDMNADRSTFLLGVGGGTVTDLTGFTAATFHRGLSFAFVPTTLLAAVDAAIGGKNGYNIGKVKNCIGTIRQPDFILWDFSFFSTLPDREWISGFAEIIKHGAVFSPSLFRFLEQNTPLSFQRETASLTRLITESVQIKGALVVKDHKEKGVRKLLNFGHTLGHALERSYRLTHGEAVSLGMAAAARLSEKYSSLSHQEVLRLQSLLELYRLPVHLDFKPSPIYEILVKDKKKRGDLIDFVLLEALGRASLQALPLKDIRKDLHDLCCNRS